MLYGGIEKMKKVGLGIVAAICLLIFGLVVYPIWTVSRPSWPELSEEQKTELLKIAEQNTDSEDRKLEGTEINEALGDLRPHGVWVEDGVLVILLTGGGIGPGWGYLISPTGQEVRGYEILRSSDRRFKRFMQAH